MQIARAAVDQLLDKFRNIRARSPFSRQIPNLLFAWNLASQEKPKETCAELDR